MCKWGRARDGRGECVPDGEPRPDTDLLCHIFPKWTECGKGTVKGSGGGFLSKEEQEREIMEFDKRHAQKEKDREQKERDRQKSESGAEEMPRDIKDWRRGDETRDAGPGQIDIRHYRPDPRMDAFKKYDD